MAGISDIITGVLGIGTPTDEENLQKADDLVSMLAEQQGFSTEGVTALGPRRETQQAGLASTAGIPQIGDAPVVGPILDFAVNKATPLGELLRLATPEGVDIFLGGEPTGARPWDWKAGPGRSALESGMRPESIQQQLMELDLPSEDKRKSLNRMQRIIDLRSAETNYQRMMRNIGSEENPGGYDPEYMAGLEALRGARTEDGGHDPLSLSQFIDGVAAAETRRTGRLKEEARQRQETKEITAQEQAELNLRQAEKNLRFGDFTNITSQAFSEDGRPIMKEGLFLQNVWRVSTDENGNIRRQLVGHKLDTQALRPSATEKALASVVDREVTRANSISGNSELTSSLAMTVQPYIEQMGNTNNPDQVRGTFREITLGLSNALAAYDASRILVEGVTRPDINNGWDFAKGIPKLTKGYIQGTENWEHLLSQPRAAVRGAKAWSDGQYYNIAKFVRSVSKNSDQQARLTGNLMQIAVMIAQAQTEGRLSESASSPRAASEGNVKAVLKEMNKHSSPGGIAGYLRGSVQALINKAQNRADTFSYSESIEGAPLPRSPKSILSPRTYEFFTGQSPFVTIDTEVIEQVNGEGEEEVIDIAPKVFKNLQGSIELLRQNRYPLERQ